ncbi:hypothetical protein WCT65_10135 [Pectobacterium carotovorum]|uniref:hypothetical protein n=1 Tax=Pectobacterium carotovorum TaxID=554 RepID=UPI003019F143
MNKSSTIGIFLIPTFIWLSLAFSYAFFCGDRDVDTYFLIAGILQHGLSSPAT